MSRDRSPPLVRSFLANIFGLSRHPPRQPSPSHPPARNNNTDRPHRPTAETISTPASAHVAPQRSPATTIVSTSATRKSAPPSLLTSPSPSPPHELLEDVAIIGIEPAPIRPQVSPPGTMLEQTFSNQGLSRSQAMGQGPFYQAHDFVMNNPVFVDISSDNFMASFLKETIPGAEFDSSDPNMPLRCHPGTRIEIIKRCQEFILSREGRSKLRWVVGAAGVGKSAIMQSVARGEYKILADLIVGATIFFSVNGRQDGTKTITTIAYQLAVKLNPYRLFVQREITHDPSLLRKSLSTQFEKFIVEPFIHQRTLDPSSRLLIIIDGLDECANLLTQQELLGLISDFCITYPTSPIVWMIASRPEPHIISFFSQPKLALPYDKEEILVDSGDAHEDVKYYLRDKFKEIQMASITLRNLPQWPSEDDFSRIARSSGGLFAYASTVIRYINDLTYGDPVGQLEDVLEIIKTGANVFGDDHPMAQLDALYARIMSRIPAKVMANTRKLLLLYVRGTGWTNTSFHFDCNVLGMTENAAYSATHHIHSIAFIPGPAEAAENCFHIIHKSFYDYLLDFKRSGFSPNFMSEAEKLLDECILRIPEQAPDGVYMDGASDSGLRFASGFWKNGPGTGDNISISWPAVGEDDNRRLRLKIFQHAVLTVMSRLGRNEEAFCSPPRLRVLTTCFTKFPKYTGFFNGLAVSVFDESRRHELLGHGLLKQVPLETLDYDRTWGKELFRLRFRSHTGGLSEPWNTSCTHTREGNWEDGSQDWLTNFAVTVPCDYCLRQFTQHFEMGLPGHLVTIFNVDLMSCVAELRFMDPDDGVSEWIYHFLAKYKVGGGEA